MNLVCFIHSLIEHIFQIKSRWNGIKRNCSHKDHRGVKSLCFISSCSSLCCKAAGSLHLHTSTDRTQRVEFILTHFCLWSIEHFVAKVDAMWHTSTRTQCFLCDWQSYRQAPGSRGEGKSLFFTWQQDHNSVNHENQPKQNAGRVERRLLGNKHKFHETSPPTCGIYHDNKWSPL